MTEDRQKILCDYYGLPKEYVDSLIQIPQGEARKKACRERKVDPYILRTMLEYSRYDQATQIEGELNRQRVVIKNLHILDFGCLVSDYGIFFARRGALIYLYDKAKYLDFALYRFRCEDNTANAIEIPAEFTRLFDGIDLAIFGEVLEHMENPLEPLEACVGMAVRFIFTSCYPFGDESYFAFPGHSRKAQYLQPACLELLRRSFQEVNLGDKARLWMRPITDRRPTPLAISIIERSGRMARIPTLRKNAEFSNASSVHPPM